MIHTKYIYCKTQVTTYWMWTGTAVVLDRGTSDSTETPNCKMLKKIILLHLYTGCHCLGSHHYFETENLVLLILKKNFNWILFNLPITHHPTSNQAHFSISVFKIHALVAPLTFENCSFYFLYWLHVYQAFWHE